MHTDLVLSWKKNGKDPCISRWCWRWESFDVWIILDDEELIKNVAQEMDQWESDSISRQQEAGVPTSCSTTKDEGLCDVKYTVLIASKPAAPLSSRAGDIVCRNGHESSHMSSVAGNAYTSIDCQYPISTHTPSRTQFISHVAPVTPLTKNPHQYNRTLAKHQVVLANSTPLVHPAIMQCFGLHPQLSGWRSKSLPSLRCHWWRWMEER